MKKPQKKQIIIPHAGFEQNSQRASLKRIINEIQRLKGPHLRFTAPQHTGNLETPGNLFYSSCLLKHFSLLPVIEADTNNL